MSHGFGKGIGGIATLFWWRAAEAFQASKLILEQFVLAL